MPTVHIVRRGDSLSSLAERYGFDPERIWTDPANSELCARRPDPEILAPGDRLVIPDKALREVKCETGRVHQFRRVGVPAVLSLRILDMGVPRGNERYVLEVEGRRSAGKTDASGVLRHWVPPSARRAELFLGPEEQRFEIAIGAMAPIDEPTGVQKRLRNLGFDCGEAEGEDSPATRAALARFQESRGLPATGKVDVATRTALLEAHDTQLDQPPPR